MSSSVEAHYNTLAANTVSKRKRRELETFPVRDYNNELKRHVLASLLPCIPVGSLVLDLCCGRGGDIFKYNSIHPRQVAFVDISANSIAEARRRYDNGNRSIFYDAEFVIADCFTEQLREKIRPNNQFNLIVCHFAMHYAFESAERASTFFESVNRYLAPGGFFVFTIPSTKMIKRRATPQWKSFGNRFYQVEFPPNNADPTTYGFEYTFSLQDAVDKCQEYLVPDELLQRHLQEIGLISVIDSGFLEYASGASLMDKYPLSDTELSDVCSLYRICIAHKPVEVMTTTVPDYERELSEYCAAHGHLFLIGTLDEQPGGGWICHKSVQLCGGGQVIKQTSPLCNTAVDASNAASKLLLGAILQPKHAVTSVVFVNMECYDGPSITPYFTNQFPNAKFSLYCTQAATTSSVFSDCSNVKIEYVAQQELIDSAILIDLALFLQQTPHNTIVVITAASDHAERLFQDCRCITSIDRL